MRVWMDQGGTFTDVVRVGDDGAVRVEKQLSDAVDLETAAAGAGSVRRGTTVATNALLERKGAPTLLIVTAGFGDLAWLGDHTRPELFALRVTRPPSLATATLEVAGRIDADGEEVEPHEAPLAALRRHRAAGLVSAAVVLVHGPRCPEAERRLGALAQEAGFAHVSLGHEVAPSRGFLARLNTTLADAALSPLLPRAPGAYMRSDGGLAEGAEWRGRDAVLSGPAGGVIATAALAARLDLDSVFGFDMGGTSTDVCRVAGAPERVDRLEVGGLTLRVPAVRLETVAAGGGSRLAVRAGVYAVGPESAGASPGPACYGRGGPATLTDAEAVLGRLPDFPAICGPDRDGPLDLAAARAALGALDPDRPLEQVAAGFRAVAAETMAAAVRRLAAAMGVDPAEHALLAFGGAGPGHALAVARRLGIRRVVVPRLAGLFSAVGIGLAARRAERVAPLRGSLRAALAEARQALPFEGAISARLALRHVGVSELIEVPLDPDPAAHAEAVPASLLEVFHGEHRKIFGFDRTNSAVEAVEVRVAVEGPATALPVLRTAADPRPARRVRAWFDGWVEVPLLDLAEADGLCGPALLRGAGCTLVLEPGWRARATAHALLLEDEGAPPRPAGADFDPAQTAVVGARLTAIAEQMGEQLARLARSVNIRERRDFSAAVFDAAGRLVVNAPHVPVHLGAMGETVRDLLRHEALAPGQRWASNDPYAGGSHLPDITVIAPVFAGDRRLGFVACRGHHVDVGGSTPGSMPPDASRLDEEGLVLRRVLLVAQGRWTPPPLPGCREPATVLADLEAQVAAVSLGEAALGALAAALGPDALAAQQGHLERAAAEAVAAALARLGDGEFSAEERLDDGTTIRVSLRLQGGGATLRLEAPPHRGNLNAPRAVAQAALLYVLRCLVDQPLPLNEGALDALQWSVNPGGLFDPRPPAAVAGGNVETSQRLTDALLRAVGAMAASQGTMNNLTVGTARGAWYETIAGGSGAGPGFEGAAGVQVHMTNTRATDVEELEARFPVRLERVAVRAGSGGSGRWRGGDGLEKQWRFLEAAEVALLAGRRDAGAPGGAGGGPGAPGEDARDRGQGWAPAPRRWTARPGDRLRVRTPGGGGWGRPGSLGDEALVPLFAR